MSGDNNETKIYYDLVSVGRNVTLKKHSELYTNATEKCLISTEKLDKVNCENYLNSLCIKNKQNTIIT